jgi:hypothetical protein
MGKIGELLNKDIGGLAAKVLKADVGDMVKGAGRALNTDVSTIAKGAGKVLTYDLADLFTADNKTATAALTDGENAAANEATENGTASSAKTPAKPAQEPAQAANTASTNPEPPASALPKAKLTEALVNRQKHRSIVGTSLATLLPLTIGAFARPANAAQGDIANDPVSVTYSSEHESLSITLEALWDEDEAHAKLHRRQAKLENVRYSVEQQWAAGIDAQGLVFIWTREQYCFEIVSPRGVSPVARFLGDFPY